MRGVAFIAALLGCMASAQAGELHYVPVNPTFGGNPFNGPFLLGTANANNFDHLVNPNAPNPFTQGGSLTFRTRQAGPVAVQLFDLRGRVVGTVMESASMPAGYHDAWIPRTINGKSLPSGVYFYRIRTSEGTVTGRFTVMR